jgi:transposase InsO family protein
LINLESAYVNNEACFNSKLLRLAFGLLGIKHQTTDVACPWQNGRIERFFLTFKSKINQYTLATANVSLQHELDTFRIWYNHTRPHQNLNGLTPKEVWVGKRDSHKVQPVMVSAWHGLLTGFYFPD